MRDAKGRFIKGYSASPETQFKKGESRSPATQFKKGNVSWSKLNPNYMAGKKHWNWKGGRPKCIECGEQLGNYKATRCNLCAARTLKSGRNNPRWNGGTTPLRKAIRELVEYNQWRKAIFERDGFACVQCGSSKGGSLNADHYPVSFAQIIRSQKIESTRNAITCTELWDTNNGRTLCVECHQKTENYLKRIYI